MDTEESLKATEQPAEPAPAEVYSLHVRLPREMQELLTKSAVLASKLELITEPELTALINLYISWGQENLKGIWAQKMGIR